MQQRATLMAEATKLKSIKKIQRWSDIYLFSNLRFATDVQVVSSVFNTSFDHWFTIKSVLKGQRDQETELFNTTQTTRLQCCVISTCPLFHALTESGNILTGPTQLRITKPCWHMMASDSSIDTSATMISMSVLSSGIADKREEERISFSNCTVVHLIHGFKEVTFCFLGSCLLLYVMNGLQRVECSSGGKASRPVI